MIGFDTLDLLQRGMYIIVFIFLAQTRLAFNVILKECPYGWNYLFKAYWFYIFAVQVFIISAPSAEFSSVSVISCEEILTRNLTDNSGWDELDLYRFGNAVVGPVIEYPLQGVP